MFDIGFPELLVIAIVALLVIGPERLPEALRTLGLWLGRLRRAFTNVKAEIEKEIGMDEIRRQLHNEAVMEEMRRIERDVRNSAQSAGTGDTAGDHPQRVTPGTGQAEAPDAPQATEAPDQPQATEAPGESGSEPSARPLDQPDRTAGPHG